jgi:hypothetical protein
MLLRSTMITVSFVFMLVGYATVLELSVFLVALGISVPIDDSHMQVRLQTGMGVRVSTNLAL